MSNSSQPLLSRVMELQEDWIDYNGHLNMAFYNVLFDRGCDDVFDALGIGANYAKERQLTIYTAECHVRYIRELHMGDKVQASVQIVDHDEKRLHIFEELRHVDGWLSATSETLALHVDMTGPKVTNFPPDIMEKVTTMADDHARLPIPEDVGRRIEIRRK